ncbi:MAG: T9SS type A sorting domain-containing protein [Actinobacteria bacterium]|nr:T9SS type A sorting domain-containing protein [Actinomycetota bacterium]
MAVLKNSGDKDGTMRASLALPPEFEIINGDTEFDLGLLPRGESDTLRWILVCNKIGDYQLKLQMTSADSDTALFDLSVPIVDRFWHQDDFFLSAWSPPSAWTRSLVESSFDYYHKANFDLTLWVRPTQEAVDLVARYGMKCLVNVGPLLHENEYLRAPHNTIPPPITAARLSLLDDVIAKFKNDSTVVGYFITDEPKIPAYPNLGKVVAYLRKRDPERLCYINLYPSGDDYDNYVQQFLEIVKPEILSYDRYIFFKDHDGGSYFSNLSTIRKWALRYDIPFCNIVQAIGTDFSNLNWRTPSEAEHRWLTYSSLAYGAKGLVWFHWDADWGVTGSPDRDQIYASLKKLNAEIKQIGPIMVKLKTVGVYHSSHVPYGGVPLPANAPVKSVSANANLVVGLFKDDADQDYVMLMNKNYHDSVTATVTLNRSVQNLKYFNADSGSWQNVDFENTNEGAVFESTLRAGGGKLYAIGKETAVEKHDTIILPQEFYLEQNYPNPFNPRTTIEYEISQNTAVKLSVHDVLGREVAVLLNKRQDAGVYKIFWDAAHFPSGIYIYTLYAGDQVKRRKMLLLR